MFGKLNFQAGLGQLQEFGEKLNKIKADLEANLDKNLVGNAAPGASAAGGAWDPDGLSFGSYDVEPKPQLAAVGTAPPRSESAASLSAKAAPQGPAPPVEQLPAAEQLPATPAAPSSSRAGIEAERHQPADLHPNASSKPEDEPNREAGRAEQQPVDGWDEAAGGDGWGDDLGEVLVVEDGGADPASSRRPSTDSQRDAPGEGPEAVDGVGPSQVSQLVTEGDASPFNGEAPDTAAPTGTAPSEGEEGAFGPADTNGVAEQPVARPAPPSDELPKANGPDVSGQELNGFAAGTLKLTSSMLQSTNSLFDSWRSDAKPSASPTPGSSKPSTPVANGNAAPPSASVLGGHPQPSSTVGLEQEEAQERQVPCDSAAAAQDDEPSPGIAGPAEAPEPVIEDLDGLSEAEVRQRARALAEAVAARELQLQRKGEELASMQDVTQKLMTRNEELALRAQRVSEEDLEAMRAEFEARLAAEQRRVHALTRERDELRRGSEKLSGTADLVKEKDNIISQVMEEGERLSKKQLALETTIRGLRAQLREAEVSRREFAGELATERERAESAVAARARAEAEAEAARREAREKIDAEKQHYEGLLKAARAAQLEAEGRAATAAKEGLAKKLREAESRAEALADTVEELRAGLERNRAAADLREDMLRREMADLERRCHAAEARHEDLAVKLPEATRPLLRQIEAMQASASGAAQAWAATERALSERLHEAEQRLAGAQEHERLAVERLQAANTRVASLLAALEAARGDANDAVAAAEAERAMRIEVELKFKRASEQLAAAGELADTLRQQRAEAEQRLEEEVDAERRAGLAEVERLQAELRAAQARLNRTASDAGSAGGASVAEQQAGRPPALAGPGYKWVLTREGDPAPQQPAASTSGGINTGGTGGQPGTPRGTTARGWGSSAAEAERLRDAVRQKEDQVASLRSQLAGLEATRDSLAEELVRATEAADAGAAAQRELAAVRAAQAEAQARLAAAVELLGEREERLEELRADVQDVKQLYKEQIEFMVGRLNAAGAWTTSRQTSVGSELADLPPGPAVDASP